MMYGFLREYGCGIMSVSPGSNRTVYGSKDGLLGREGARPGEKSESVGVRSAYLQYIG